MRKFRRMGLSLVLAVVLLVSFTVPAMAGNPTVAITVTARVISITNSQNQWPVGIVAPSDTPKWGDDDTHSEIENTGNADVHVRIQGTDLVDQVNTDYNWTLAASGDPGDQAYGLKATGTEYNIIVKKEADTPGDITTDLAPAGKVTWSMTMYVPTAFHGDDGGGEKQATVTLIARVAT